MAETSARALKLLSLLGTGATLTAADLATRLRTSLRTIRRDIDTLRDLGYDIESTRGVGGGYRLGRATKLPPVVFDEEQAVAVAVALQTVPSVLGGIREDAARALITLNQAMPTRSRQLAEAFTVSLARNYWEFPSSPIDAETVRRIGTVLSRKHLLRAVYPNRESGAASVELEPYELVVWAARWYLVGYERNSGQWCVMRIDRLALEPATHTPFARRPQPYEDPTDFVMRAHDRGDTVAHWPCRGTTLLDLPADLVARYAPGGSTVDYISDHSTRLSIGAWSWAGVAGLMLTFGTALREVEPAELREALRAISAGIGLEGRCH